MSKTGSRNPLQGTFQFQERACVRKSEPFQVWYLESSQHARPWQPQLWMFCCWRWVAPSKHWEGWWPDIASHCLYLYRLHHHCCIVLQLVLGDGVGGGEVWLKMRWRYRQRNGRGSWDRERGGMGAGRSRKGDTKTERWEVLRTTHYNWYMIVQSIMHTNHTQ